MAKILLVEDDNNLREIYEARLQAEGYDIVAARDGEEALTVAMKERPDLIISDVMMPKISGFDMLDIIRSTEETKNVKVIMMTALSQAEDKARADKLGADRYLVKSQVTLEDVAKVARDVLSGATSPSAPATDDPAPAQEDASAASQQAVPAVPEPVQTQQQTVPTPTPVQPTVVSSPDPIPAPATDQQPVNDQPADDINPAMAAVSGQQDDNTSATAASDAQALGQSLDDEQAAIAAQIESFIDTKQQPAEQMSEPAPESIAEPPENSSDTEVQQPQSTAQNPTTSGSTKKKVIQPISDPTASKAPDLENLLQKEEEKEQMSQIAHEIAEKKGDVSDELTAEATLRNAARAQENAQTTDPSPESQQSTVTDDQVHAPEVAITEDGNLQMTSEDQYQSASPTEQQSTTEQPATTGIEFEETPAPLTQSPTTENQEVPIATPDSQIDPSQPPKPNIPHTNGTSIDGVVSNQPPTPLQPATTQQQPAVESPANNSNDPDAIAL